jgi:hypothetical protein
LTATPARNLVTNIGTGAAASNTRDPEEGKHGLKAQAMAFPLVHPTVISRDPIADDRVQQLAFGRAKDPSLGGQVARFLSKMKRRLPHFINSSR